MVKQLTVSMVFSLILVLAYTPMLHAQWVEHGTTICTEPSEQYYVRAVTDGEGGAIIAWRDYRNGNFDIYVQRVDGYGMPYWTANGVAVCTNISSQTTVEMVSDGEGGAVITWQDNRNGNWDVYAQRIDPDGLPLWTTDGVAVCTDSYSQMYPVLASDGTGGAIITWTDYRAGLKTDIYAQRIDASGSPAWIPNGAIVCNDSDNQSDPVIAEDDFGGAYIFWMDDRNGNWDIYGQRIYYNSSLLWGTSGYSICSATNSQGIPAVTRDGAGGVIIAWEDYRSGTNNDIYAQRITNSAVLVCAVDGIAVCAYANHQTQPVLTTDGLFGAIIAWQDIRTGMNDIYAQRLSATGSLLWAANGVAVSAAEKHQELPEIISDGMGGAISTWRDNRYLSGYEIFAQRINENGNPVWTTDGVAVSVALADQQYPSIATDGDYGAIIAFLDYRTGNSDIAAQRIERNGYWGYPAPTITGVRDIPGDEGGYVNLSWDASRLDIYPESLVQEYTVWRAIDETAAMAILERGALLMEGVLDFNQMNSGSQMPADENRSLPLDRRPVIRRSALGSEIYYWIHVSTVEASYYVDNYADVVETLFDSTATSSEYHYFQVIAHEADPTGFWISAIDSGYSVDNLAPCPPQCLAGEQSFSPEGLNITWSPNEEVDLDFYVIYRGLSDDFVPGPGNLIASPCDTMHFDGDWRWDTGYWYKVAAVDVHGNESCYSLLGPTDVTGDDVPVTPLATYLEQNYPNPFNPTTRIAFGLSEPGQVSLRIYDASGKLVRLLVDERREAGRYEEMWDGKDDTGRKAASGIYFYRLAAGSFKETKKMVLLR